MKSFISFTFGIFVILGMIACQSNTIYERPTDLIEEEQMVDLLTDLHIARYASGKRNDHGDSKVNYTPLVYEKYGIDSARYMRSNIYYASRIDEYKRIYQKVELKVASIKKYYDSIKMIEDSIAREKVKVKKDSFVKNRIRELDKNQLNKSLDINLDSIPELK
jgi:hypothetical protein